FLDMAIDHVEKRTTPTRDQLAAQIGGIRNDLARPQVQAETFTEQRSFENAAGGATTVVDKAGVRLRTIQPAIDMRPHQWKRQAIIVNGADVDPTVALQMKTRRVVGIEGQPYYD
ncbi:hypothetical protein, partial [Haemophilus influenzae]|uniref:hypothetical protein n=1 Tax=Haemophilus influenzae TaxID=727 RepID=UPI0013D4CC2D